MTVNEFIQNVNGILEDWREEGHDSEYHFRDQLFDLARRFTQIDPWEEEEKRCLTSMKTTCSTSSTTP